MVSRDTACVARVLDSSVSVDGGVRARAHLALYPLLQLQLDISPGAVLATCNELSLFRVILDRLCVSYVLSGALLPPARRKFFSGKDS